MLYTNGCWTPTEEVKKLNEQFGEDIDFYYNYPPQNFPNRRSVYFDIYEPSYYNVSIQEIDRRMEFITVAFTKSKYLLEKYPNKCFFSEKINLGADINYISDEKEESVSFLLGRCYPVNGIPGYQDRLYFWVNSDDVKNFQKKFWVGCRSFPPIAQTPQNALPNDDKTLVYKSMFNVCIENGYEHNFFTEKLKNCLVTKTVPIYLGCPNIGDYYDVEGMIIVKSWQEALDVCNNLSPQLYYDMLPKVIENSKLVTSTGLWNHVADKLSEVL